MTRSESAIVTGAAGALGRAIVHGLVESGRIVLGVDLKQSALDDLADTLPNGSFVPLECDVTLENSWKAAAASAEHIGQTTVLVNCAGISPKRDGHRVPGLETDLTMWEHVMDVNLTSAFLGIRTIGPLLVEHRKGRIVNIGSMAGRTLAALAGTPYAVSKAGMLGLTRSFAGELGPSGVTVNAIAPGRIASPMLKGGAGSMGVDVLERIPMRRYGNPEDIAAAVRFLASDDASFITGTCLDVNGGQFMA